MAREKPVVRRDGTLLIDGRAEGRVYRRGEDWFVVVQRRVMLHGQGTLGPFDMKRKAVAAGEKAYRSHPTVAATKRIPRPPKADRSLRKLFDVLDAAAFEISSEWEGIPIEYQREAVASSGVPGITTIHDSPGLNEHWSGLRVDTGSEARVYAVRVGPARTGNVARHVGSHVAVVALFPLLRAVVEHVGPFTMPHSFGALTLDGSITGVLARGGFPEPFFLRRQVHKGVLAAGS